MLGNLIMESNISIFECSLSYLDNLAELGMSYYPPDHHALSHNFLKWFYLDNPYGPAKIAAVEELGKLIGVIAFIPIELESSGIVQKACYAVNVLTHPDHRGKNLFIKMIKCASLSLSHTNTWLLGHPNASAVPGWKRQKMKFTDPLHVYVTKPGLRNIRLIAINSAEQVMNLPSSFWQSLKSRSDMHAMYSPEYIRWRFIDAPHKKYSVYSVFSRDELVGLRISRRYKGPVDLLIDAVATTSNLSRVLSSGLRPTLFMHAGTGISGSEVVKGCWRLPIQREFPFFVTDWSSGHREDLSGITLSASDF